MIVWVFNVYLVIMIQLIKFSAKMFINIMKFVILFENQATPCTFFLLKNLHGYCQTAVLTIMITSRDKINYATKINRKKCTKCYPNTSNYELGCSYFIVRHWLVFVGCWDSLMFIIKNHIHYIGLPFGFNRKSFEKQLSNTIVYDFKFLTFVSHETNHRPGINFKRNKYFHCTSLFYKEILK